MVIREVVDEESRGDFDVPLLDIYFQTTQFKTYIFINNTLSRLRSNLIYVYHFFYHEFQAIFLDAETDAFGLKLQML